MSHLVFKDGLPLFKSGQLQFAATSPPPSGCCCAPARCCYLPGQSLWCEVNNGCVGAGPFEFIYNPPAPLPGVTQPNWTHTFECPGGGSFLMRLVCRYNDPDPAIVDWVVGIGSGTYNISPLSAAPVKLISYSCIPFEMHIQVRNNGFWLGSNTLCTCATDAYVEFTWTL